MKISLIILLLIAAYTTPTVVLFCHLFKRMLDGFDVPDGELEFWEWTERMENDSNIKRTR